ncbi:helix-turn-helix transcriptional regulator [Devosia psychrophila]|uniref:helix-turn-helix transcriptional regulator n=1 Tax=Devosia psychrophila TaxID=728005 RepID=UPI000944FA6B|nr:helix-turn-helix transcriptional regulator [Devosia psychrophila]
MTVANARKGRGYSQQEFADLAGVGRRFLSELENGKPTAEIGKVLQVLTALGIDMQLKVR